MSITQLGIFAKYWTPGRVKTRLAATIGDERAAQVAEAFIQTLVTRLGGQADRCVIGFTPTESVGAFAELAGDVWQTAEQSTGDLGERMRHYFQTAFAAGADRVLLLGADSPDVPLEHLQIAFQRLETERLVLGPTDDGGYYLIGARGEPPPVFDDMPFSTESLWQATEARLTELGWRRGEDWSPLPAWYDVDTIDEIGRLRQEIAGRTHDAPLARLGETLQRLLPESESL